MSKKIELRGLFGTRWTFRTVGASRGLGIQAFKSDNRGVNPDVNVGLSVEEVEKLRDFIVEKFGPGEGYVKVGEGVTVTATGNVVPNPVVTVSHGGYNIPGSSYPELPERRFKVGDRVQIKAGDANLRSRLNPDNLWIGRTGSVAMVDAMTDEYAYEVKIDDDDSATLLPVHEDEVEPEVTWKYKVGDLVRANDTVENRYLKFDRGEITNVNTLGSGNPESPYAYTVKHGDGYEVTYKESELTPYVGQTLGDLLDRLPVGTVIHFDRDSAIPCWAKRSDGWYSTRNGMKLNYLLDYSPRSWPFTVVYNPDTDN